MPGWEVIVVILVVAVAAVWSGRAAWRSVRSGKICSSCEDSGSCPMVGNPEQLNQLGDLPSSCPEGSTKEDPVE